MLWPLKTVACPGLFKCNVLWPIRIISFIVIRIREERGDGPFIHTFPIGTMLNFNDGSNGHSLKMLCVTRP